MTCPLKCGKRLLPWIRSKTSRKSATKKKHQLQISTLNLTSLSITLFCYNLSLNPPPFFTTKPKPLNKNSKIHRSLQISHQKTQHTPWLENNGLRAQGTPPSFLGARKPAAKAKPPPGFFGAGKFSWNLGDGWIIVRSYCFLKLFLEIMIMYMYI